MQLTSTTTAEQLADVVSMSDTDLDGLPFGAIRLDNGNTLIAGGNNNRVQEIGPKNEIVWQIDQKELPGITLAWVTTLKVLANGNIVIGNCHAGKDNPQLIEVTREKKVVWTFQDFKNFDNNTAAAMVLDLVK